MKTLFWTCVLSLGVCGLSLAGPERPIRSTTFSSQSLCGPLWDPLAAQGQWFQDVATGSTYPKIREFHDDANPLSISGYVTSILFDGSPMSNIVAFTIQATVLNNLPSLFQQPGTSNSHGEVQMQIYPPYSGPMQEARIAAEFAVATTNLMPSGQPPYYLDPVGGSVYCIVADNETEWAWYCWAPQGPNTPYGAFQVPSWKLGTIPVGGSQTVQMNFKVSGPGMPMLDYRHSVLRHSFMNQSDVLYNRHNSLKISHWLDTLLIDYGSIIMGAPGEWQGAPDYEYASNVSVFFDEKLDFGDAPDPRYPTLLVSAGARHIIVPGIFMGGMIDAELDGQPNVNATGDDLANLADEDGVVFTSALTPGFSASFNVTCSVTGFLSVWVDFDGNGSWGDVGEQIFSMTPVNAGVNTLTFLVPTTANLGTTFARFRFTTQQAPLTFTGLAGDGEVEDYQITLEEIDFGDAQDNALTPGYPTLFVNNGAAHRILPGVQLGGLIDAEPDGQPNPNALGDDLSNLKDEDGVLFLGAFIAGATVNVQVTPSTPGYLNAWIDWNSNGSWADAGEHVYSNRMVNTGPNLLTLNVPVPPALVAGGPHTRWRFTTYAPAVPSYTGKEFDGEVEDYEVTLQVLDFGDAPAPYPTLLGNDGARHDIPSDYYLGAMSPDLEPDGQPHPSAAGDDTLGVDDEDGVLLAGSLVLGSNTFIQVVASTNGWLNAWLDYDQNGSWFDSGEQIASDVSLTPGTNAVPFTVSSQATLGQTFGRFRFSSYKGLLPTGRAYDGEVEDYAFTLYQAGPTAAFSITNIVCNASNGVVTIQWTGESAVIYETQYADALSSNMTWTVWGPYVRSAPYSQTNSVSGQTSRFYRVSAPYIAP